MDFKSQKMTPLTMGLIWYTSMIEKLSSYERPQVKNSLKWLLKSKVSLRMMKT